MTLAPIVLFTYARPEHTRKTLKALAANVLAKDSELIIYIDGPRNSNDIQSINAVHSVVNQATGFRSVKVIQRKDNYGLARNITEGVSETCARFGKVIVLEDDIVTSPYFLTFMNQALDQYKPYNQVWHISGWNYPINFTGLDDAFFWGVMNCWGWGTWEDRWQHFKKDPKELISTWSHRNIHLFNLDGAHNFWSQVEKNHSNELNTWAIFWYATIFEKKGFCLNPLETLVHNIGHDGSGEHCGAKDPFACKLSQKKEFILPEIVKENSIARKKIIKFYYSMKPPFISRLYKQAKKYFPVLNIFI